MYLVHSNEMCAVQFVAISNIIHHHPVAMMHPADMTLLLGYAQFCMEFVENAVFLVSHGPAKAFENETEHFVSET